MHAAELSDRPYRTVVSYLRIRPVLWGEMQRNFQGLRDSTRYQTVSRMRKEVEAAYEEESAYQAAQLSGRLYDFLKRRSRRDGYPVSQLADEFDVAPKKIREALESLEDEGKHISRAGDVVSAYSLPGPMNRVTLDVAPKERIWVGVVSDTHYGSKKQQPSLVRAFMEDAAEKYELECWLHCGDLVDGFNVYKGQAFEVWIPGFDEQVSYTAENYPDTGVPTYMILGNHDENHIKNSGANVGAAIEKERADFEAIGVMNGQVDVGGILFELHHPGGGGAYAKSYGIQQHVRAMSDSDKPHVLLHGHLHQYCSLWERGVWACMVPSFQATTTYIRRLAKGESMVGGMVVEIGRDDYGDPVEVLPRVTRYSHVLNDYPRWVAGS